MASPRSKDEYDIQMAYHYYLANPQTKIARIAREFGVDKQRLRRRYNGIGLYFKRRLGNTTLFKVKDKALMATIDR